jgi:hypothetical protein
MESKENQILSDSISDLSFNNFNNGIIQDNKLVFLIGDNTYRVRMPIQSEQALIDNKRNMAQLEYIKQEGCITKKQLIYQLQKCGVFDIDKAEESREQLTKELKKLWFILATKSSENTTSIQEYSDKITAIQNELKNISIDIATQLAPSLESRLEKFTVEYMTFVCTDKQEDHKWIRVWETFEDFQKADTSLVEHCAANMTWIVLNKRA